MACWGEMGFYIVNSAYDFVTEHITLVTTSYIGQGNTVIVESEAI